jgi:hypothetical protein
MQLRKLLASAAAIASLAGGAQALPITVDLGFIIDESGSVNSSAYTQTLSALQAALATVPNATADVQYRIGVVGFGSAADTVVAPITITSQADRNTVNALLEGEKSDYANAGSTNFTVAMERLREIFDDAGGLGDVSIANFATDGNPNVDVTGIDAEANGMISDGWDAMSFEAIGGGINVSNLDFGFQTAYTTGPLTLGVNSGLIDCGTVAGSAGTTDPLGDCFIVATSFADLQTVYTNKVISSILVTGGDPNVVPLPAAGWLLLGGLGALFGLRRRKTA